MRVFAVGVPLHAALGFSAVLGSVCAHAAPIQVDHLSIELVSQSAALVPGQTSWLGLYLRHDPHWHTYWINPGDSGLPTKLVWSLPEGFEASEISWPAPSRFEVGGLTNFGYTGDWILPIALKVPASLSAGQQVTLSVEANWLICREECIPGKANLSLALPIAALSRPASKPIDDLFARARSTVPRESAWTGTAHVKGERIEVRLTGDDLPDMAGLDVFAQQRRVVASAPARLSRQGDSLLIAFDKNEYFDMPPPTLDLVLTSAMTNGATVAWKVRVPFVAESPAH